MTRAAAATLAACCMVLAFAPRAVAQERGKGKERTVHADVSVSVGFSVTERRIVTEYFTAHAYDARALPPGIAKNLARGKPLPPGIAKRQLPAALATRLPRRPGLEISIVGDRVVLLEASGLVVDILAGVLN
jgi:hypothetical protein